MGGAKGNTPPFYDYSIVIVSWRKKGLNHMNSEWHNKHPLPPRPTLEKRIEWHLDHAKNCACRPIPPTLKEKIQAHRKSGGKKSKRAT